ncbi:DNA (cytosine-5-)-methyltransferase [Epilithonimonas ginsengisoli]|uniref:Cytosine-specific methyltransferase n=1 Tax=Epilithonimonas ginsengisoli TaxID=1245592 RepID=A0ABU4JE29_9FLAO|nr:MULTISPECIES: DNA (cytosine-5-)-methyltransferase [Chryseobacterium group]MBV6879394.1 DNA (cytosine-5-)-methyltransferase [Epilithonimonas sp. FP105]MDW8547907.1 DNA (cytosine-5-)-methyltransferase [Epilithonimonas ginsengisoli]OAH73166.1 cytosine methyltransferase [Chryseobacterium sp. FP211-J200]
MKKLKVIELFAGVGGFRIGLQNSNKASSKENFEIVWSNQWEPSTKTQHASLVYESKFSKNGHSNENIALVPSDQIPEHDMLVGGFPCQDYSVATTLKNSKGLQGKKGVLWWEIYRILESRKDKPKFLFLENVDRLLKSPTTQRGRDFAIMLKCLSDLGYAVEWRVINAADYGMPQKRRRTFILSYLKDSEIYNSLIKTTESDWLLDEGVFAKTFEVGQVSDLKTFDLDQSVEEISESFNKEKGDSPFQNSGMILNGKVTTMKTTPNYEGKRTLLKDILIPVDEIPEEYFIDESDLDKWNYLKGAKKEVRQSTSGFSYNYGEGAMIFPDNLESPSRTIITGEGGKSASRFKHVVRTSKGLRRLTPIELERLNMFPDNHTLLEGVSDVKRAFFMGNALVVGVIEKVGETLLTFGQRG